MKNQLYFISRKLRYQWENGAFCKDKIRDTGITQILKINCL